MIRLLRAFAGDASGYAATQYAIAGVTFALAMTCLLAVMGGDVLHSLFFGGSPMK